MSFRLFVWLLSPTPPLGDLQGLDINHDIEYVAQIQEVLNPEALENCTIGSKATAVMPDQQKGCTAKVIISVLVNQLASLLCVVGE